MKLENRKHDKNKVGGAKSTPKVRCDLCMSPHTHVDYDSYNMAKYYCCEHWPHSKDDWRYRALQNAWLKNKEEMTKLNPEYASLSSHEQYEFTQAHSGGRTNKKGNV